MSVSGQRCSSLGCCNFFIDKNVIVIVRVWAMKLPNPNNSKQHTAQQHSRAEPGSASSTFLKRKQAAPQYQYHASPPPLVT
jgi:hypothetical protein